MGRVARPALERLGQMLLVAVLVATACFGALQALPGDLALHVAAARYGEDRVGAGTVEQVRRSAGLDRPIVVQYASWLGRLAAGDAGRSLLTGKPVRRELVPRLGVTLGIGVPAAALALLLAAPLGIVAGVRPGGWLDKGVTGLAAVLASVPSFAVGTLLVAILAIWLRWLPAAGAGSAAHGVLPAATLALALLPGLARVVRHAMAGVVDAPYVAFARMRGVPPWRVVLRVMLRPALLPVVSYLPVLAMQLIEGFVTVELVFNLDGVGSLLVRSLLGRDIPVVMGASIVFVLLMAAASAATDLLLRALDPRPVPAAA